MLEKLTIYTDGGARGNPGPAAIAAVINDKEFSETIGETTNNIAEYKAVILGLKKARQIIGKEKTKNIEIEIFSDSELIVNQQNGLYKVKEESLKELFIEIWNLRQEFKKVTFTAIPREKNKKADSLVNFALNHAVEKLL